MDSLLEIGGSTAEVSSQNTLIPALAPVTTALSNDKILDRRVERVTRPKLPEPTYEFTRDPGLLSQYYMMREEMYMRVWGLDHFPGQEDEYDRKSHIIVARIGNQVVGGARLFVPSNDDLLPLETKDFRVKKLFPELELASHQYGELSRLVLQPEYFGGNYFRQMLHKTSSHAKNMGVEYLFGLSPYKQIRNYRRIYESIHIKSQIFTDIMVPEEKENGGIKLYLGRVDIYSFDGK